MAKQKTLLAKAREKFDAVFGGTPPVIRVVLVLSIVAALFANVRAMKLASGLRARMSYCVAEIKNCREESANNARYLGLLNEEHAKIRDAAVPLMRLAQERFNEKDPSKALELLAADLGVDKQAGTDATYARLPRWLRAKTIDALNTALAGKWPAEGRVVVSAGRTGDLQYVVTSDLVRLLRDAGVGVESGPRRSQFARGDKRIQFYHGAKAEAGARALAAGLADYVQGERQFIADEALGPSDVQLVLHGTPDVRRDGVVFYP